MMQRFRGRRGWSTVASTLILMAAWTTCAWAQSGPSADSDTVAKDILQISSIDDDAKRLAAYYALAATLATAQRRASDSSPSATGTGKWQVQQKTDPITDEKQFFFVLPADSGGSEYEPIALIVRKVGSRTEVLISWSKYLADNSSVTTRFDDEAPVTRTWDKSTDSTATFVPGDATAFVRTLATHTRLVARITPYDEGATTAVFDLTGLASAIEPYQSVLGWLANSSPTD